LTPDSTIHAAAVETGIAGETVTAGAVIASPAVREAAFASEPSSFLRPKSPCFAPGTSASSFIRMSAFVTTPSGASDESTTGMPPIRCSASIAATSFNDASGPTVRTSLVMRSSTLILCIYVLGAVVRG